MTFNYISVILIIEREREVNIMDWYDVLVEIICFLVRLFIIMCVAFCIWFAISYADIIVHNLSEGYQYPSWNLFILLM